MLYKTPHFFNIPERNKYKLNIEILKILYSVTILDVNDIGKLGSISRSCEVLSYLNITFNLQCSGHSWFCLIALNIPVFSFEIASFNDDYRLWNDICQGFYCLCTHQLYERLRVLFRNKCRFCTQFVHYISENMPISLVFVYQWKLNTCILKTKIS